MARGPAHPIKHSNRASYRAETAERKAAMQPTALNQEAATEHIAQGLKNNARAREIHTANGYPYQALPTASSIRLLEFHPVQEGRPRVLRMHIVDLLDNPQYAALSYTWGGQGEPGMCICDGHDVRLTANLAAFSQRFKGDGLVPEMWYENERLKTRSRFKSSGGARYDQWSEKLCIEKILPSVAHNLNLWPSIPASPRLLWIDSLCINQQDSIEVNKQLLLMGEIYRKAELVNVWLGEEEDTEKTLTAMRALAEVIRYWHMRHNDAGKQGTPIGPLDKSLIWEATNPSISKLLNKFEGQAEMDGQRPRLAANYTVQTFEPLFNGPWYRRAWTYQESQLASRKLFSLGPYNVPDTHMQAALCILGEHYAGIFDVHKGVKTMISTASSMITNERRLPCCPVSGKLGLAEVSLIELLLARRGAQSTLPSDSVYSLLGLAHDGLDVTPDYKLSWQEVFAQSITPWLSYQEGLSRLFAECNDQSKIDELPSWVPDWRVHYGRKFELPITRHTPCPSSYQPQVYRSACKRLLHLQGHIIDSVTTVWYPKDFTIFIWGDKKYPQTGDFPLTAIDRKQKDARFFDTSGGYLGQGVSQMRVGDKVAVIYGLCKPLILRPTTSGLYRYIGQCYICLGRQGDEGKHVPETQGWLDVPEELRNTITLE